MQHIKTLPFRSQYASDDPLDCVLCQSDSNICEFNAAHTPDPTDTAGACDPSGLYYGTTEAREPMFCARHFYVQVIAGTALFFLKPEHKPDSPQPLLLTLYYLLPHSD